MTDDCTRHRMRDAALSGRDFELHVVDISSDADGRLTASRPVLLTSRFGVDATSGLSWAP